MSNERIEMKYTIKRSLKCTECQAIFERWLYRFAEEHGGSIEKEELG